MVGGSSGREAGARERRRGGAGTAHGRSRMITRTVKSMWRGALVSAGLLLVGCAGNMELGPDAVRGKVPDGTVDMQEVQAAYIGSGSAGTGVLAFRGTSYPFKVGGVGVG